MRGVDSFTRIMARDRWTGVCFTIFFLQVEEMGFGSRLDKGVGEDGRINQR